MALAQADDRSREGSNGAAAVVTNAAHMQEWLRGKAAEIEQWRSLTPEVVERLVAEGLFRITQPSLYGGLGLDPRAAWADPEEYDRTAQKLVQLFVDNFAQFEAHVDESVRQAAPQTASA